MGCGEGRHLLDARDLESEGVLLGDRQADLRISGRLGCLPRMDKESFSCNARSKIDGIWTEQCRFWQCVDRRAETERDKEYAAKLLERLEC